MQSLIYVWISLLIGLLWASGCFGQTPTLTLEPFSGGCPSEGSIVQVKGTLNMEGVPDTSKYVVIDLVDTKGGNIASKSLSGCQQVSSLSCNEINSTYYSVTYKGPANPDKSEFSVKLQTYHSGTFQLYYSPTVLYPVVEDAIIQKLEINNTVTSLNGGVINVPRGNITVSYNITGVSLSKLSTFGIEDASNGKLLASKPASGSEISADIDPDVTKCIHVTYNTTNGCSDGTPVCFSEQTTTTNSPNTTSGQVPGDGGGDGPDPGTTAGITVAVVAGVGVTAAVVIYIRKKTARVCCSPKDSFEVVLRKLKEQDNKAAKDSKKKMFTETNKITFYWKDPNSGGKSQEVALTSKVEDVAKSLGHPVGGECVMVVMKAVQKGENVKIHIIRIGLANPPHPKDKTDAESGGCGDAIDGSPSNNTDTTSKPKK